VITLGAGRFSFAHDLVRETLYESLDETQARTWHALVVRALERSDALAERILPADRARHAYLAGDQIEPAKAIELLLAAARDASGRLASEEEIAHYLRAYERAAADTPRRRVMIALDLARALYHIGDRERAWNTWLDAVAVARELDDPELLARVALSMYGYRGTPDQKKFEADLLGQAHEKLVPDSPAPDGTDNPDRLAQELTVRVAMLARTAADDEALGFGLWARHNAIWGPGSAAERLALTDELLAVARRAGDQETEFLASSFRWVALLELGDARYLEQFKAFLAVATQPDKLPLSKLGALIDQSIIATLCGRFKEAEAMLDEATASFEKHQHVHFAYMTAHLRWALLLLSGRFDEAAELNRSFNNSGHPSARLIEAITAVHRGDTDFAVRHVTEVLARDEPYNRFVAPLWARLLAQTAAATRDPTLCERARAELAPYRDTWAVSLWGCDISGPMAHWSALVDAAQERWDEAIDGFTAAHTSADRLQARPWSIEARCELAATLPTRGAAGDVEAATALLGEVEREAAEIGMRHILDRCARLRSTMDGVASAERAAANEFRFTGEVWTLTMDGRTVHLPDTKGLRDIHHLLGRPGTDVPAVELLDPEGGQLVVAARRMGGDAVLDEEAKIQYKRRLAMLDEEIDAATERGDDQRAASLDRERAALLDELRAAAGLAGRSRRLGDETERARKTVTARIRDTLRKLDDRHPELAAHLRATISTGVTCRYQPDREITWRR
jgi:tetratricopeptide (TPR) repeat protein